MVGTRKVVAAACALVAVGAGASRAASEVIHVDLQGDLQAAIDGAGPGDVILVWPGSYPGAYLVDGKGISLVGEFAAASFDRLVVRDVPAGQTFTLQGVTIRAQDDLDLPGVLARDNAGALRFQGCTLRAELGEPGQVGPPFVAPRDGHESVRVVNSQSVTFVDCELRGGHGASGNSTGTLVPSHGGPGLEATNSRVLLFDTFVLGGTGGQLLAWELAQAGLGGDGVLVQEQSLVQFHGTTVQGGTGGSASCSGSAPACGFGGSGGDALEQHDAGSSTMLRDATLVPGGGGHFGTGASSGFGAPGLDVRVLGGSVGSFAASHRTLRAGSPVREDEFLVLDFAGEAGDAILLFAGLTSGYTNMPFHQGVFLVGPPFVFVGLFVGTLPPEGALSIPVDVPELGPGITAVDVVFQAAFLDGADALLAAPAVSSLIDVQH